MFLIVAAKKAMNIAADADIYTNHNFRHEVRSCPLPAVKALLHFAMRCNGPSLRGMDLRRPTLLLN